MPDQEGCVCARCNSADPDKYDFRAEIKKVMNEHGVAITGVFPANDVPGSFWFVYTIGMIDLGLPELVVTGMPAEVAHPFLMQLYSIMTSNAQMWRAFFDSGGGEITVTLQFDDGTNEETFRFRRTIVLGEPPLGGLNMMYGPEAEVFQVIISSEDGAWPGEPGWDDKEVGVQPLLQAYEFHG